MNEGDGEQLSDNSLIFITYGKTCSWTYFALWNDMSHEPPINEMWNV